MSISLFALACVPALAHGQDSQDTASSQEYGARAVISLTPVMGAGVDREKVPSNAQVLGRGELGDERGLGLDSTLLRRVGGVVVNDVQNNPLQPDLSFRGFSISPLLGTPQGLAIYQNGVRINEPFGDVVQWELVPEFAIDEVQLLPGANPVFGLNSLGGSIGLRMKNGFGFRGLRLRSSAGSFGRVRAGAEYGRVFGDTAIYEGLDGFHEDGFRDASASEAYRLYTDLRHRLPRAELAANLTIASTELRGNGPAPVDLLERSRERVFTLPDITENGLVMLALTGDVVLGPDLALRSLGYIRLLGRDTLNGDEAEFAPCPDQPEVLCSGVDDDAEDDDGGDDDSEAEPEVLLDEQGRPVPASAGGSAAYNTTRTFSVSYGAALQLDLTRPLGSLPNQLSVGTSVDLARVDFRQRAEVGTLTERRSVDGSGIYLQDDAYRTSLETDNRYVGFFATDTLSLTSRLHATAAARLNVARVELEDQLSDALDGVHHYLRLNPALGIAFQLGAGMTTYASYSESNRVPSAAELACADPEQPCRVPNAFLADPPLEQVVSRALEIGLRGRHRQAARKKLSWALAAFGSRNFDDILFVAGSRIGTGYFRNAGQTQRVGGELSLDGRYEWFSLFGGYQFLLATFERRLELPGDNHPEARIEDGRPVIDVEPGDRIPGLPVHSAKLGFDVEILHGLIAGAEMRYSGSQYLRGDEANELSPLDGYVVLGAHASYRVLPELTLFVDVENLLDSEYETFGLLGEASEVLPYAEDPRFLGPGAPFGLWIGAELALD